MNKYKKLVSNTAILSLGTLASKVLVYLLLPLYTLCLSPEEYSVADLITQTANLLLPILAVGMVDGIFRFAMDKGNREDKAKVFCVSIYTLLFGSIASLILYPVLSSIDLFGSYGWLILLYVFASNLHQACAHFLRGCGNTILFSVQGIIATALTIALNLVFLLVFDMGILGYVLATVISDLLLALFLFLIKSLWKNLKPSNFDRTIAKNMIKYSLPMIPTTIFWWVTNVADRYMISYSIGQEENGLYAIAFKIPTLLILVSGIFSEAWQYSAVTDSDSDSEGSFFSNVFGSFQGMIFICASGLIIFAKIFSRLLFAKTYYEAWKYMPVLIFATVFSSLVTFMSSVYVKNKRSINSFLTAMIGAASNVILNLILIPVWGAQGAAIATLSCYVLVYIIRAIDTQRFIKFKTYPIRIILNSIVISVQCAAILLEVKYWVAIEIISLFSVTAINFKFFFTMFNAVLGGFLRKLRKK